MLASLSYELPANLECEAYMDAINWLNRLPNTSNAASQTPYQLVTGSKSSCQSSISVKLACSIVEIKKLVQIGVYSPDTVRRLSIYACIYQLASEADRRTRVDGRPSRSAANQTWKDSSVWSRKSSNYASAHVKKTLSKPHSLVSVIAMKTNLKTARMTSVDTILLSQYMQRSIILRLLAY
jgi:hypothetical protein